MSFKGFIKNVIRSIVYPILLMIFIIYSYSFIDDIKNDRIDISWITNMMNFFMIPGGHFEEKQPEFSFSNNPHSLSFYDLSQTAPLDLCIKHLEESLINLSQQCYQLAARSFRTDFDLLNRIKCYNYYDFKERIIDEGLASVANPYHSEYKKFQKDIIDAIKSSNLNPLFSRIELLVSKCGGDCKDLLAAIIDIPNSEIIEAIVKNYFYNDNLDTQARGSILQSKDGMKNAMMSKLYISLTNQLLNWKHSDHKNQHQSFKESIKLSSNGKYNQLSDKLKQSFVSMVNMLKGLGDESHVIKNLKALELKNMSEDVKITVEKLINS